jgi:hypothetical protein
MMVTAKSRGRSRAEVLSLLEAAQNLLETEVEPSKGKISMQAEIRSVIWSKSSYI